MAEHIISTGADHQLGGGAAGAGERPLDATPDPAVARRTRLYLILAVGVVAAVRLWYCAQVPVNTGDLLRFIHQALYVLRDGPAVVATPLADLDPGLGGLSWARVAYSYPPLALPFFVAIAALSPSLFAAKLALTLVEAANAWMIARASGSRWLGALYWASPMSIWWVSGEGQFEPLMAFFMIASVLALRTDGTRFGRVGRPVLAAALIALGVLVKLTAVLLVPWLTWRIWREYRGAAAAAAGAFVVALVLPIAVGSLWYPVIANLIGISSTLHYNPYYWNVLSEGVFLWNPRWLISVNALATYGVLAVLGWRAWSTRRWDQYLGIVTFVVLVKVASLAQFWYFLLFPAFALPIGERRVRFWMIALAPLLDLSSLTEMVFGPFGWIEIGTYDGIDAMTEFDVR